MCIKEPIKLHASAMKKWISRVPNKLCRGLRTVMKLGKSKDRNYRQLFDSSETTETTGTGYYRPSNLSNRQRQHESASYEDDTPAEREDRSTLEDNPLLPQNHQMAVDHTSKEDKHLVRIVDSNSTETQSQSEYQHMANTLPFPDEDEMCAEIDSLIDDMKRSFEIETLEDPFGDNEMSDWEWEWPEEEEENMQHGPDTDRYINYSADDAKYDMDLKMAIIEQARRFPAHHLAASRDALFSSLHSRDEANG
ncbi:hypothetical protein RRF57_007536 [Xylaria bambusicola]|uniref:Uncharacterized protein n=1 Tax=Xylaria bambusicola TaxID=326684 RepID=A0AAN7Z7M0_9PEZI